MDAQEYEQIVKAVLALRTFAPTTDDYEAGYDEALNAALDTIYAIRARSLNFSDLDNEVRADERSLSPDV